MYQYGIDGYFASNIRGYRNRYRNGSSSGRNGFVGVEYDYD